MFLMHEIRQITMPHEKHPQILLLINLFGIRRVIKYSSCVIYWDNDLAEKSKGDKSFKRRKSFALKTQPLNLNMFLHIFFFICQKYGEPKKELCVNYINFSIFLEKRIKDTTTSIDIKNWYLHKIISLQKHFYAEK